MNKRRLLAAIAACELALVALDVWLIVTDRPVRL